MIFFDTNVDVRYADTDQMGVVHHSVYACYCELGRIHLCDALGLPYHDLEEEGIFLMVVDMTSRFKRPIRYGVPIYVRTGISRLKRRLIAFEYEIRNRGDEQLLFTGTSTHLFSKRTEGATDLPREYWDRFAKGYEQHSAD